MSFRILLTTTSYQDTPGKHHELLKASGFEVVRARGPLKEQAMLDLIAQNGGFDGLLNGDDEITQKVLEAALAAERPLKVVANVWIHGNSPSRSISHHPLAAAPSLRGDSSRRH